MQLAFGSYHVGGCKKWDTTVTNGTISPNKVKKFDKAVEEKLTASDYGANCADISSEINGNKLTLYMDYNDGHLPNINTGSEHTITVGRKSVKQLATEAFAFIEKHLQYAVIED